MAVKRRDGTVARIAVPIKALAQRFAFFFLVMASIALMLFGRSEPAAIEKVRTSVVDIVVPIMDAVSRPAATISQGVENVKNLFAVYSENDRLREEVRRLQEWQAAARKLSVENLALRNMLNYIPDPEARYVSTRVIGDSGGVFVQSMLVNVGTAQGVHKGQAVVTGGGLIGRIAAAGNNSSRVLLLTDLNSRIPVLIESTRERAIMAGDNSAMPKLVFLSHDAEFSKGDRIVTSGHGGLFPPGLPVGEIAGTAGHTVRVKPNVALDRLEFVRVIDYRSPGIRNDAAGADETAQR